MPKVSSPFSQNDANDTIKILLATDNHIGYNERDPIRGRDSIDTFEEILQLAVKHDVDFILLAGDLFHENRPSRDCIYRVIALLREYTLGEKPVQVELLSDPDEGKAAGFSFPAVNYEDPNFNVGIPVFSIHGNHDDPQGAGPEGALCALDLLSVTGLLNYMGKIDLPSTSSTNLDANKDPSANSTGIVVRPVLLRKGETKLGLYGIGNVKDARMHFELRSNRVKMYMPKDKTDWFNLLLLHQNRVKRGPQESVPEGMFDDSIDLVVWGHEHDCRIIPEPVAGKEYYISQPGSSVATSLADGESLEKHVALLTIHGKDFHMDPIPLRTVRPFVIDECVLIDSAELEGFDVTNQIEVGSFLKRKVNELIEKANAQWEERNQQALERGEEALPPMLPLIRLKVDTTEVSEMFNPIRFGHEFTGRVANPRDVLVFHRSKRFVSRSRNKDKKNGEEEVELSIDDPSISASEKLQRVRVGNLVKEYLAAQEMQLLGELGMSDAIEMFVEKDDPHAISTYVSSSLRSLLKGVKTDGVSAIEEETVDEVVQDARKRHEEEYKERHHHQTNSSKSKSRGKSKAGGDSDAGSMDSMMMDLDDDDDAADDFDEPEPVTRKKVGGSSGRGKSTNGGGRAAAKKTTTTGRGRRKADPSDDDEDEEIIIDEDDDDEEERRPAPTKKTNRAAVLGSSRSTQRSTATKAAGKARQTTLSFAPSGVGARGKTSRAAASNARSRNKKAVEISDDED